MGFGTAAAAEGDATNAPFDVIVLNGATEITPERLEYLPWATLCIKCQELEERGLRRRKPGHEFEINDEGEEAMIGDDKERA